MIVPFYWMIYCNHVSINQPLYLKRCHVLENQTGIGLFMYLKKLLKATMILEIESI